jgi:hypothetical protein
MQEQSKSGSTGKFPGVNQKSKTGAPLPPMDDPEPIMISHEEAEKVMEPEEPLTLVSSEETSSGTVRVSSSDVVRAKHEFKRAINVTGTGATRCRLFYSKIAANSLEHLEHQINTWVDAENIEIKEVGHMIGIMRGKSDEQNVIIMVWY